MHDALPLKELYGGAAQFTWACACAPHPPTPIATSTVSTRGLALRCGATRPSPGSPLRASHTEAAAPDLPLPRDASSSDAATKAPSALFQIVRYALFMSLSRRIIEMRST